MQDNTLYKHFNGGIYRVICKAKHADTLDDVVVYEDINTGSAWIMSSNLFYGYIDTAEYKGFRFIPIK